MSCGISICARTAKTAAKGTETRLISKAGVGFESLVETVVVAWSFVADRLRGPSFKVVTVNLCLIV